MTRLTIGVPVFNGARHLRESLECLRTQSYNDFRVVVSDNGSTDATPDICADFAARDSRFVHLRRHTTVPVTANFKSLCDAAQTELFMWRAYDDLSDPDYLTRLVALFDEGPEVALAVGSVNVVSLRKGGSGDIYRPPPRCGGLRGLRRRLFESHAAWYYGVWRTAVVRRIFGEITELYPYAWAQDHLILLTALLEDAVRADPRATFVQRLVGDPGKTTRRLKADDIAAMRTAFAAAVRTIIARHPSGGLERLALRMMAPIYAERRCHSAFKLIKARIREAPG